MKERRQARLAGLLYFLVALIAPYGVMVVPARLLVSGDAQATTAQLESQRIHDVTTSLETEIPESATRVLVLYRISNGFARPYAVAAQPGTGPSVDSRFDVQVRQALPFMDFAAARWEMLVAVRNFLREAGSDQSVYDELLVVRPPKRIVGGLTLHF